MASARFTLSHPQSSFPVATGYGVLVASHDEELPRTWCDQVITWDT